MTSTRLLWLLPLACIAMMVVTTNAKEGEKVRKNFQELKGDKNGPISDMDIGEAKMGFCKTGGFPKKDGALLNSPEKVMKFKNKIKDKRTKQVFDAFDGENPLIDLSEIDMEDAKHFLDMFVDEAGDLVNLTLNGDDITSGEGFDDLINFVVDNPEAMKMLKKPAVQHIIANLTMERLEDLCENLDNSEMSDSGLEEIFRKFPQCVRVARNHIQKGMKNTGMRHGRVVLDRIRSAGMKLNITDFLLDPWDISLEDVDGLEDSELVDMESLKAIGKILHLLDEDVARRLAERVIGRLGNPASWAQQVIGVVGQLMTSLPDEMLQEYVNDAILEIFLNRNFRVTKKVASFMIENLYAKRNEPSFHKRFCLSIYHYPYITVSMLDGFTSMELWEALRHCPEIFYELAYEYNAMKMVDRYYGKGDGEEWHGSSDEENDDEDEYFHQDWDPEYADDAYEEDVMESFMEEMKPYIMQLRPLLRKIFSDKNLVLNATQLMELGMFLPAAPSHVFKMLPVKVLLKAWPKMQRFGKFPAATLQVVMDKLADVIPEASGANASTAHLIGQALVSLPCGAIDEFPENELVKFVLSGYFKEVKHFSCEINEMVCRTVAKKAMNVAPKKLRKLIVQNLGQLGAYLETEDFDDEDVFFNEYLPDSVESDMFERKEKKEKDEGKKNGKSKFDDSDEERVLNGFINGDDDDDDGEEERKGKKMDYKEALKIKAINHLLKKFPLSESNFTERFGEELPKRFNASYLLSHLSGKKNEIGKGFSMKKFGDVEYFLNEMFDVTFEEIVQWLLDGEIDVDSLDFDDMMDDGVSAVSEDFLEKLPVSEDSIEFLKKGKEDLKKKAGKKGGSVEGEKLSSGFKAVKKMFDLDGNKTDICIEDSIIDSLDCYFTRARKYELDKLSKETRKAVFMAEGKSDECVKSMNPDEIQEHFEGLLEVDDELREAKEWNEDMLVKRGPAMLCGMGESHVEKLTPKAAVRLSGQLCHCRQLSNEARREIFGKIKKHYSDDISNIFTPPFNLDVASCLMYAPAADLKGMDMKAKKIFVALATKLLEEVHDHIKGIEDTEYFGVEELVDEKFDAEDLASAVWIIMGDLDIPPKDRISQLSRFKSVINVDFINSLSKEDFEESIDSLRDYDEWTEGQKEALSGKIKEVFGEPGTWNGSKVMRMGGLLSAVMENSDGFEDVDLDECALEFAMERFSDNDALFDDICEKLTMENALKTIKKKPQAACCMDPEDASSLNATLIMKAIKMMGNKCHPCLKKKRDLLSEYAQVVSEDLENKPEEDLTKDVFEDLKCLSGKMSGEVLGKFSEDALERFDPDAIEVMDAKVFCKIAKKDFLKKVSGLQSEAIDDAKLECMDNEQFEALWEAVDGGSDDDDYVYDEGEVFPDFSETEIGDSEEFDDFVNDFAEPLTQSGGDNKNVQCVSTRGSNVKGLTNDGKTKFREGLDEDETDLFDDLDDDSNIDFSEFSTADIVEFMDEVDEAFEGKSLNFTQFLKDLPEMVANPKTQGYDAILEDAFENLDPEVYTMVKPKVLCDSLKKLKKNHLEKLCGRLLEDDVSTNTFLTINSNCPVCFTYWVKNRKREDAYNILDKNTAPAFFRMRLRQKKPLDLEILALGPKAITPDIIEAVDPKVFGSVNQLKVLSHPKVAKDIPKNSIKLILKKVIKALGPIKGWNKLLKSRLQYFLFYLPRKELQSQLTPSDVIEIVKSRDGETEGLDDPEIRKILGQAVNKYVMKKSKNIGKDVLESPQVFCLLLSSGMPRKLLEPGTSPYDVEFLIEMASKCGEFYDIPASSSRKFFRIIINSITKDKNHLMKLKPLLALLPANDISKFPKNDLKSLWNEVKDQDFDEFQMRVFWDAIKDGLTINCDQFKKTIGKAIRVAPRSVLENAQLFDCLDDVMKIIKMEDEEELPQSVSRGLWKMVKNKLDSDKMNVSAYIMSEDFPTEIASLIPKSEYDGLELNLKDKKVREKAFKMAEEIGEENGYLFANVFDDLDLDDPEVQNHLFENDEVASVILSSLDDDEMDQLEAGDSEGDMLEDLAEDVDDMSQNALEKNFRLMKKRIKLEDDCEKESICMDEGQATVLGPLFVGARAAEIECFTQQTKDIIIESIGQHNKLCKRLTSAVIQKLFSFVDPIKAMENDEDLEIKYGCMICGFTKDQIMSLSDEQVVFFHDTLTECHQFRKDVKDILMAKIFGYYGGFVNYLEANPDVSIGTLLMSVPVSDIKNLDADSFEYLTASLGDITAALSKELEDMEERRDRGELSAEDYDEYKNGADEILSTLYDRMVPSVALARRKRAAPKADEQCDTLATFNGNLCFLKESQINSLSDKAVADCVTHFQKCSYSTAVFTTLATKAKNSLGAVTTWQTSHYASLGKLLGFMGDATIAQMKLTDDVMDVISKEKIENGDKLFNRYLSHNSKTLKQMTGENIADYSLLLGSLKASELNELDPNAVAAAVKTYNLGGKNLKVLEHDVVELFTNKLIESNTINFNSSTSSDISNLGVLAGKLPENVLTNLNSKQKSGIKPDAIKLIEPKVLANSFKASDFSAMTSEQANALSKDQLNSLSKEQKAVVSVKSTTVVDKDNDSGDGKGSTISVSLGMLLTVVIFSLWTARLE